MQDQIKLEDCPEILRDAVNKHISDQTQTFGGTEIISITMQDAHIYRDADSVRIYKVYTMTANFFTVFYYTDTPPDRYNIGVIKNSISIGEVKEIMRATPEWFD